MASTLPKLLRKTPAKRIIAALHDQPAYNCISPFDFHKPLVAEIKPEGRGIFDPGPFSGKSETVGHIYPCFPFGFCFNAIVSTVSVQSPAESEAENEESDYSGKVWADSVKKKRKRKMNKHKYRKLRKRLRRQT